MSNQFPTQQQVYDYVRYNWYIYNDNPLTIEVDNFEFVIVADSGGVQVNAEDDFLDEQAEEIQQDILENAANFVPQEDDDHFDDDIF